MNKSSKNKLVNDIEHRLNDFFGDNTAPPPPKKPDDALQKLKSVVLSIDWEITDKCLSDLINETEALLPKYNQDRLSHALLRMLQSLGRYIRKRKAQAHPDAIKRVMSVFASLEKVASTPPVEQDLKRRIIAKEIAAFKNLKQQVEKQGAIKAGGAPPNEPAAEGGGGFIDQQKFEKAMSAVEQRLKADVEALRVQLAGMQKELNKLRKT